MVKAQVESQIKVRDLSNAKLSIEPADATSWSDVRTELIAERKALLRSELETELSAANDESAIELLRKGFSRKERMIEHEVDSQVRNFPFYYHGNAVLPFSYDECVRVCVSGSQLFGHHRHRLQVRLFCIPNSFFRATSALCACDTHHPIVCVVFSQLPRQVEPSLSSSNRTPSPPTAVSIRNAQLGSRGFVGLNGGKRGARPSALHAHASTP